MAKLGSKDNGSLLPRFMKPWTYMVWANVNFRVGRYGLDYLPIWWYLNHQNLFSTWFTYLFDHMHEKMHNSYFIKIPSHFVRLLRKIHALSIEVLLWFYRRFSPESQRAGKAMKKLVISCLNLEIWQACDSLKIKRYLWNYPWMF